MAYEWPIDRSNFPDLPDPADPGYAARLYAQEAAATVATSVLWHLSGRRFGLAPSTVRPCPPPPRSWYLSGYRADYANALHGAWGFENGVGCGCFPRCRKSSPYAVHLPGPAAQIVTVTIGAVTLAANVYVLENDTLYRRDVAWPGQDYGKPAGEDGTWSVTYLRGEPVPAGVDVLTGMLAREMIAATSGSKCRLPSNITAVSRNGVTYQVYNPNDIFANGKTGLSEVDLWLSAINPHHLMKAPSVL